MTDIEKSKDIIDLYVNRKDQFDISYNLETPLGLNGLMRVENLRSFILHILRNKENEEFNELDKNDFEILQKIKNDLEYILDNYLK